MDLNDAGTMQLAQTVKKRCGGIPRAWPNVEATQANVERYVKRDQQDTVNCASAGISYVKHIETRDRALTGKKK